MDMPDNSSASCDTTSSATPSSLLSFVSSGRSLTPLTGCAVSSRDSLSLSSSKAGSPSPTSALDLFSQPSPACSLTSRESTPHRTSPSYGSPSLSGDSPTSSREGSPLPPSDESSSSSYDSSSDEDSPSPEESTESLPSQDSESLLSDQNLINFPRNPQFFGPCIQKQRLPHVEPSMPLCSFVRQTSFLTLLLMGFWSCLICCAPVSISFPKVSTNLKSFFNDFSQKNSIFKFV